MLIINIEETPLILFYQVIIMKPFVNYIGSKYTLINSIKDLFPEKIERYFEPFIGGGSVFLYLNNNKNIKQNFINDTEYGIINCYKQLKKNPTQVIDYLNNLENYKSKTDFSYIVDLYNNNKTNKVMKAALFIYLSKISFNSRLNYNKSDDMIKPNFSKANTLKKIYNKENLISISKLLKNTLINRIEFETFLYTNQAVEGDFVFFDPPYFVEQVGSYYKNFFTIDDYKRLLKVCNYLTERNVKWMITVNNIDKIKILFKKYNVTTFEKYSRMSSGKGKEYEMIIRNYK